MRYTFISFVSFLFGACWGLWAEHHQVAVSNYGILPNGRNMSPQVETMLQALRERVQPGDSLSLYFDDGTYHFWEEGAPERELYISNHDQVGLRRIAVLLEGWEHLRLIGAGEGRCQWLIRDRMLPVALEACRDVLLQGISIDFSEPQISQVEIVESRGEGGGMLFRPAPWVRWRIGEEGFFEAYGSNWVNRPSSGIVFEAEDGRTAYRISDLSYSTKGSKALEGGLVHAPLWQDRRIQSGMIVAMRTYERPQPAIFIDNCKDVRCSSVRIHYADGMGFLVQNSQDISLSACSVVRRHNEYGMRYFTTQADATHFSGCSGTVSVVDGVFEGMMDDAINVHGLYLKMLKRLDDYTLEAAYMHPQAYGFSWAEVGDSVQFIQTKTFDNLPDYGVIKSIIPVDKPSVKGAKVFRISFEQALDSLVQEEASIALENMRKVAAVNFSRNKIRMNRARGALFNTPKHVAVRNNRFVLISGAAIVSSTDCNQWFESGQTQDMHIEGNIFEDVLTSLYQFTEAVISLHPVIPDLGGQKTPFYGRNTCGILIERNTFRTFDTPLLYAKSVKGLCWRNNRIAETGSYAKYHWNQERFKFEACQDMHIEQVEPRF